MPEVASVASAAATAMSVATPPSTVPAPAAATPSAPALRTVATAGVRTGVGVPERPRRAIDGVTAAAVTTPKGPAGEDLVSQVRQH
jgi:hypothetical protein